MNRHINEQSTKVIFWIVRHGKTMFNLTSRVQGWSDTPLIKEGEAVVRNLSQGLKSINFDAAYSSDSGRARQTLKILLENQPHLNGRFIEDWRLRELNFGIFEGEKDAVMKDEIAKLINQSPLERQESSKPSIFADKVAELSLQQQGDSSSWPAENYYTLTNRLKSALLDITNQHAKLGSNITPNILIVSHGVAIWALWEMIDELRGYQGGGIQNASIMKIRVLEDDTFELIIANDMSYLN
ncbi:histidine phosphatase family protein [Thorsellia anophelis]|uniref:Probable phosphoglycerate mutase n=1 Tax=Thorsellia anophelis DSM 18579 TaxID=1123402 RepID=A0A1I0BIZ2_9GAMM|nr:histidine phosphatase family protein [Thorsellia anophelis]SET06595.1 probable phosphoglycerate mutase [Thorsellia anophelis DSM 18579]